MKNQISRLQTFVCIVLAVILAAAVGRADGGSLIKAGTGGPMQVAFRTTTLNPNRYVSFAKAGGLDTSGLKLEGGQTFVLLDSNGGDLVDGDVVQIQFAPDWAKPTFWFEAEDSVRRMAGRPNAACNFTLKLQTPGKEGTPKTVVFQTASGKFVTIQNAGGALATTATLELATPFEIVDVPKPTGGDKPATPAATTAAAVSTPATPAPSDKKPTIFVVGDSTARNNANGARGWGDPFSAYFDPAKVTVRNEAAGGRSTRTYTAEGRWDNVLKDLKAGDFVLIQMGHNDGGPVGSGKDRASLSGLGEETQEVVKPDGSKEIVHTYGWYLRKFVTEAKAKGAMPILMSLTVRNLWKDGKVRRDNGGFAQWTKETAEAQNVPFVDVTNIIADRYDAMGEDAVKAMFGPDYVHTSPTGADLNAASVVAGLKALPNSPFTALLSEKGQAVAPFGATAVNKAAAN